MEHYRVYHSARFDEELAKYDKQLQSRLDRIEDELVQNPFSGKAVGSRWLREKRFEGYRFYYFIYEDIRVVFMAAISKKKDQQVVINTIRTFQRFFRKEIDNLLSDEPT